MHPSRSDRRASLEPPFDRLVQPFALIISNPTVAAPDEFARERVGDPLPFLLGMIWLGVG